MNLVNYVLIGLLGAIFGIGLYTVQTDMSRSSDLGQRPAVVVIV